MYRLYEHNSRGEKCREQKFPTHCIYTSTVQSLKIVYITSWRIYVCVCIMHSNKRKFKLGVFFVDSFASFYQCNSGSKAMQWTREIPRQTPNKRRFSIRNTCTVSRSIIASYTMHTYRNINFAFNCLDGNIFIIPLILSLLLLLLNTMKVCTMYTVQYM